MLYRILFVKVKRFDMCVTTNAQEINHKQDQRRPIIAVYSTLHKQF